MEGLDEPLLTEPISNEIICQICYFSRDLVLIESCFHQFCRGCLTRHLELKIRDGIVMSLGCPACNCEVSEETVRALVSPEVFKKYLQFLRIRQLELDLYVKWCPMPDCNGYDVADDSNRNLTCNNCGHCYCYGCSQPWHAGNCKDSADIGFKFWRLRNNLKICPRCKNYVQKDGGCPHMSCPRCHFKWCWNCGKDYSSPNHTAFKCMIGKSYLELYWGIIFLMVFFPVMVPFLFFLFIVILYETGEVRTESLTGIFCVFRYRILVYPVAFCVSPAMELLGAVAMIFGILMCLTFRRGQFDFLGLGLGLLAVCLVLILGSLALVILMVIAPIVGIFFLIMKIYFCLRNCCVPNRAFDYPRVFI